MQMRVRGLDEMTRKLKSLSRKLESLSGRHRVPLQGLCPPQFMVRYTSFRTIDEMIEASGYKVESREDFAAIPDEEWDRVVAKNTRFSTWKEMLNTAAKDWARSKLAF